MTAGRAPRALAYAVWVTAVAAELVSVPLGLGLQPANDTWLYAVYTITLATAGLAVVRRHPGHVVGWLFLATAVQNALMADLSLAYGLRAGERGWPGADAATAVALVSWLGGAVWLGLTMLLFPDGRLPGPRWRAALVPVVLGPAIALPGWLLDPDLGPEFPSGANPLAVEGAPTDVLFGLGMATMALGLLAGTVGLLLRLRRSRGEERQQLKWFVFAAVLAAAVLPVAALFWFTHPASHVAAELVLTALPVAASVAILRYRLYDIDVVINRTLVYGTLTVVLAAAYAAVAVLLGTSLGRGSAWTTAGATLAVAIAFRPVRARIQDAVDRRFDRHRWDARHQMDAFMDRLRSGAAEPEEVEPLLGRLLDEPTLELVVEGPRPHPEVRHAPLRPDQEALLRELLDRGALAVQMVGLRAELRRQLVAVEESRTRIVEAGDRERRRIERDLHDGAQQRLVSIGLALRHAQHQLATGPGAVDETLDATVAEIGSTIHELRQLTHGLPPSQLDAGLGPAFHELARRSPVPVQVDAPRERFDRGLEAAAYFIGCEALTNAVKHAGASRIALRAARRNGSLVVEVDDDGAGGAHPGAGSGLRGLADRVAALGGTLDIASSPGSGTRLTAELPCGS